MYERERATPVTTPAATSTSTVMPSRSNTSRQQDLGLGAEAPEAGECLEDTLCMMGETAIVVLDVLAVPTAVRMAWNLRHEPWAQQWLEEQDLADIDSAGLLSDALDLFWPVGTGLGFALSAGGAIVANMKVSGSIDLLRTATGFEVSVTGTTGMGAGAGVGFTMTDARGTTVAGVDAGADATATVAIEAMWVLALNDALDLAERAMVVLLSHDPEAALEVLREAVEASIGTLSADEFRSSMTGKAGAAFSGGAGLAAIEGGGSLSAKGSMGWDAHGTFVELSASTAIAGGLEVFATELGAAGTSVRDLAEARVVVRVEGDIQSALAGEFSGVRWVGKVEDASESDAMVAETAWDLAAWIKGILVGGGNAGEELDPLPEVTLRRNLERPAPLAEDGSPLEDLAAWLPDHGVLVGWEDAKYSAEVVVGPDAVEAALAGQPLLEGPDGGMETMLDVERAIAAQVIGGSVYEVPMDLDLEAGAAAAKLQKAERSSVLHFATGGGISGTETFVKAGASLTAEIRVLAKEEVDPEEIRNARVA